MTTWHLIGVLGAIATIAIVYYTRTRDARAAAAGTLAAVGAFLLVAMGRRKGDDDEEPLGGLETARDALQPVREAAHDANDETARHELAEVDAALDEPTEEGSPEKALAALGRARRRAREETDG